jgi:integrase
MAGFVYPASYTWEVGPDGTRTKKPARGTKWKARYRDANRKDRSRSFDRKGDAERWLQVNSADMQRGEWIDPTRGRSSFDTWATAWWEGTIGLRETTRAGYHGILHRHVLPHFGGRRIAEIDFLDVKQFINGMLAKGYSPKFTREAVSVLSLIMKDAVAGKARKDNPALGHTISRNKPKLQPGDVPTMAQIVHLVQATTPFWQPMMWVLAFTGMRPSEVAGLRLRDLDWKRGRLEVRRTLTPVAHYAGDTGPRPTLVGGPTKTAAGQRSIPLPSWLLEDLSVMLAARRAELGRPLQVDEPLFVNRAGRPVNVRGFRNRVVRRALRKAGLPEQFRTYDLRHAHASMLIDQGVNLLAISQRLGHVDASVTLRVYGHLMGDPQDALTAAVEDLRRRTVEAPKPGTVDLATERRRRRPAAGSDAST